MACAPSSPTAAAGGRQCGRQLFARPEPAAARNALHASFDAHFWDWKLSGYYNYADFYDLFGPTKLSRRGESLKAGAFAII